MQQARAGAQGERRAVEVQVQVRRTELAQAQYVAVGEQHRACLVTRWATRQAAEDTLRYHDALSQVAPSPSTAPL